MCAEDQIKSLATKLKPTIDDIKRYNNAIDIVSKVIDNNQKITKSEIWKCGSVGKGTAIHSKSDVDAVVVCSQKQDMRNILNLLETGLKGCSTTSPEILRRAVNITVKGISMDVVPTQYGVRGDLARALRSKKEVAEIVERGELFKGSARLLKYWRDLPDNAPNTGNIPSFAIEVILAKLFRLNAPQTYIGALTKFFTYIDESELVNPLGLHDGYGNTLLTYEFEFEKKQYFIDQARHSLKLVTGSRTDLSFLDL